MNGAGLVIKKLVAPVTYTVSNEVTSIDVDTSSGGLTTIILQKIHASYGQRRFYISDKGNNASVGNIIVVCSGGDLINNAPSLVLDNDGIVAEVVIADQTNYIANLNTDDVIPVAGDKNYVHTQGVPSNSWTVTHNLQKKCAVSVVDSLDKEIEAEVQYDSINQVTVNFNQARTGYVYCN